VANPFQSPSILSFCPGILGLERGLERIIGPARVVAYVEIEAFIIANLLAGMEARLVDCAPVWTDAKTFPAQHFHNKVHGIIGGYPCQPFSIAGNRQGTADPRHLWPHLQRSIEAIKPVWCFFENVDDHLNLGFDHVHQQLCDMGFAVETGIYSASEAGAPHQRQRLFILAIAHESGFWRQQPRRFQPETFSSGKAMEHTTGKRTGKRGNKIGTGQGFGFVGASSNPQQESELADTRHVDGSQRKPERQPKECTKEFCGSTNMANTGCINERIESESERTPNNAARCNQEMSDTSGNGLQGSGNKRHGQRSPRLCSGEKNKEWPASPGESQKHWEAPRTIEPGMGCTVDGYNFREDFLRALGNSVVEQSAAIAFADLMKKHGLVHLLPFSN